MDTQFNNSTLGLASWDFSLFSLAIPLSRPDVGGLFMGSVTMHITNTPNPGPTVPEVVEGRLSKRLLTRVQLLS